MELTAKFDGRACTFDVILFDDPDELEFNFLIITQEIGCLIARKEFPSGRWVAATTSSVINTNMQEALFNTIDSTSFQTLTEERLSAEELNKFYIDNVVRSQ